MKNKSNYFSLTNDYVFKRFFGYTGSEDITTNLLEAIFEHKIKNIVLEIHIISLKSLEKSIKLGYNTNEKNLINWIKFIRNPNLVEDDVMKNEYIKKAKAKYDELEEDEHERYLAESRMDYVLQMNSCKLDGYEKGKKAGENKRNIEIAKKLLKKNMDIQTIIELTDLSKEEIEKLK